MLSQSRKTLNVSFYPLFILWKASRQEEDTISITEKTTQTAPAPSILQQLEDERSSMSQISIESSDTSSCSGAAAQLIIVG